MYLETSFILRFKQHLKNSPKYKRNSEQRPWRPPSREHPDLTLFDMFWTYRCCISSWSSWSSYLHGSCQIATNSYHIFLIVLSSLIFSSFIYSSFSHSSHSACLSCPSALLCYRCPGLGRTPGRTESVGGFDTPQENVPKERCFLFSLVFFLRTCRVDVKAHMSASAKSEVKTTEKWHGCNRNALAIPAWEVYNTKIYFKIRLSDISKSKSPSLPASQISTCKQ